MKRKYLVTYRFEDGRGYIGAEGVGFVRKADAKPMRLSEAVSRAEALNQKRRGFTSPYYVVAAPRKRYRDRRPNALVRWQMGWN